MPVPFGIELGNAYGIVGHVEARSAESALAKFSKFVEGDYLFNGYEVAAVLAGKHDSLIPGGSGGDVLRFSL